MQHPDDKIARIREIFAQSNERQSFVPEVEDFSTNFDGKKPEKDGSGAKLDSKTQQKMESGFGTDFKEVSPRYGAVADMLLSLRNNCWDFEKLQRCTALPCLI